MLYGLMQILLKQLRKQMTIKEFVEEQASAFVEIMFPHITADDIEDAHAAEIRDKYKKNLVSWLTELIEEWEKTK